MAKTYEPKTKANDASVEDFINFIEDEQKRKDCIEISKMMQAATKAKPKMWGESIVGFGEYRMKYANGSELPWPIVGFSPRKANITLYLMSGFENYDALLGSLGKHSIGKSCLYIKKLADVDIKVLKELINASVQAMKQNNP